VATKTISPKDRVRLAKLLDSEAGIFAKLGPKEQKRGNYAVLDTVMNRNEHKKFPSGISNVINDYGQFSGVNSVQRKGTIDTLPAPSKPSLDLVNQWFDERINQGIPPEIGGGLYYANPRAPGVNAWGKSLPGKKGAITIGRGNIQHVHLALDTGAWNGKNIGALGPGNKTRSLQQSLADIGYDIQVDGKLGPKTRDAIKDFQTKTGLPATGLPDATASRAIYGANAIGLTAAELGGSLQDVQQAIALRADEVAAPVGASVRTAFGIAPAQAEAPVAQAYAQEQQTSRAPFNAVVNQNTPANPAVSTRGPATPEQMQASFTGERERIRADLERKLTRFNELSEMGAITPEDAAAARARASQQAQNDLRAIDPSAGFQSPLPQTAPAAPPQGVAVDPIGVDAMTTTVPAMPTRATPSPVDPAKVEAKVTEAVRQIPMEKSPWAIPAEISPEGVIPGYPEYSPPVPTPRANPVRVAQTPELGFTPQPVESDKVAGPTMGPADYWSGNPEQPAPQYYEQDLKPLTEPDPYRGLESVPPDATWTAGGAPPSTGVPFDPTSVVGAQPAGTFGEKLSPDLSQYQDKPLGPLSDVNISTAKIGTINGRSTAVPTPPSRPAFGSASVPKPRANPVFAADVPIPRARPDTFGVDAQRKAEKAYLDAQYSAPGSMLGEINAQKAQEDKSRFDMTQRAAEDARLTSQYNTSGPLTGSPAMPSRTSTPPAELEINRGNVLSAPTATSAYDQQLAELDQADAAAGTMTPDELAQLEAMRPVNQVPAPMDLTPAQFGGPAYASSASGGPTFGSLANSMASSLDALGRGYNAQAIRDAGSVNAAGGGIRGAYGGTAEQQARTAASLTRMARADRARSDRSARSADDRGNTYNSRSTLSGSERAAR
jgi:peptidoglycan hydrolase-like protein with peptidoglycan-binding domain